MQNFQILCRIWKHVNRSVVELCAAPSPPNAAADNPSLREPLLRLLLKSGTAFYIMSRTTFKSGRPTAIAVSAE